jgi:hypothetical protein
VAIHMRAPEGGQVVEVLVGRHDAFGPARLRARRRGQTGDRE